MTIPERQRQAAVSNIARVLGDDISEEMPLLDSRLPDWSRVAAVMSPVSVGGTVLSIRKFRSKVFTAAELVRRGMLTAPMLEILKLAIAARHTILISGGTGSGKTTLLNALAAFMPQEERVVLIEDTSRSRLMHLIWCGSRPGAHSRKCRRSRSAICSAKPSGYGPDRIILGEVRGAEAFDLLQALNTGHTGTLSTVHANTARLAVSRLRTCVAMAGVDLPDAAIARNIAEVVQVLVHLDRKNGERAVSEVLRISRYDSGKDEYEFSPV